VAVKWLMRFAGAGDAGFTGQNTQVLDVEVMAFEACGLQPCGGSRSSIGRLWADLFKRLFAAVNLQEFKLSFSL